MDWTAKLLLVSVPVEVAMAVDSDIVDDPQRSHVHCQVGQQDSCTRSGQSARLGHCPALAQARDADRVVKSFRLEYSEGL